MKLTINIKDHKAAFFVELIKSLDFVSIENAQDLEGIVLTPEEKDILDQRLASYKTDPDNLIDWDNIKNELGQ